MRVRAVGGQVEPVNPPVSGETREMMSEERSGWRDQLLSDSSDSASSYESDWEAEINAKGEVF